MQDLAIEYVNEITNNEQYKRLIELKKIIDNKYSKEIIAFKTAESKYLEAKKYGKYHPDLAKYQEEFKEKKANLYKKEEVREYLELERGLNELINNDINEIKDSLLNPKFKNNNCKK